MWRGRINTATIRMAKDEATALGGAAAWSLLMADTRGDPVEWSKCLHAWEVFPDPNKNPVKLKNFGGKVAAVLAGTLKPKE
jgi:hypothetical protein